MTREETVILMLAFGALVTVLVWQVRPGESVAAPADSAVTNLTYNQPFMFAPPVANIMPNAAASQLGVPSNSDVFYDPAKMCGC